MLGHLHRNSRLVPILLCLFILSGTVPITVSQDTATFYGVIRYEGAPIADVFMMIFWEGGETTITTTADGVFRAEGIPIGSWVQYHIRPPLEQRLAYRNGRIESLGGDMIHDFDLESGFLLNGDFRRPDGQTIRKGFWLGVGPMDNLISEGEWLGDGTDGGSFNLVLPPGYYSIMPRRPEGHIEQPDGIKPYFFPSTRLDLTSDDITGLVITLVEALEPLSTKPPRIDLITVSEANSDGMAVVTGAAGTVPPMVGIVVFNLNAHTFNVTVSDTSGGFSTSLYAPEGSSLLVKYSLNGEQIYRMWEEGVGEGVPPGGDDLNELPGAIFQVGDMAQRGDDDQPFTMVGSWITEQPRGWIGWQLSGTMTGAIGEHGLMTQAGHPLHITGRLRITSPGFSCVDPVPYQPGGHMAMQYVFGADGTAKPWGIWFTSHVFTPTGLPIEYESFGEILALGPVEFTNPVCVGNHTFETELDVRHELPLEVNDGIYRPFIWLDSGGVPMATDVPMNAVWYGADSVPAMAPIVVGNPAHPHIPWTLLGNYPVNGHRGIQAREDVGQFMMTTRVLTPPHQVVIPRLDARTGEALVYHLEPGSHWISASERRQPNPPYIPFALPSGELTAWVQKPDGTTDVLGPSPIRQSSITTPTTPGGSPIDHGTGQVSDLYHLTTMDESFAYQFDLDGTHTIKMEGHIFDVYGNVYTIDGTYDVVVARILDIDPAQLPTTPYIQGDAFAPGLHVFPAVPADVTIQVTHLPYSDPEQAVTHTFVGTANSSGIFQAAPGDSFIFDTPGEFRVDISATYQQVDGTLWAGTMTWGNVVEGANAQIEAHGRRTMAHLPTNSYAPSWFEVANLPPELSDIEICYPYFSGDIHWGSQTGPGPGDSIQAIITFKDITPNQRFYNLLRENARGNGDMENDLETQIAVGEAPLMTFTRSDRNPSVYPEDITIWSYWYGSSERPDVRVREAIGSPWISTVYWRFDDTYGYQIGEGAAGDLPGDLKWEFGGAVLRVLDDTNPINEYSVYSSLWVLLPDEELIGARISPPFQDATGASINGGPIMTLRGEDIDMLFLPKSIRPGDLLEIGDTIAFSGHVGPPLDSQVSVKITSPSGVMYERVWHANRIGWLYDPSFDFVANETGRWTIDVAVLHDRPYVGNGVIPASHNTGTVLGTRGQFEFYVVPAQSPHLIITEPQPGIIRWEHGHIEPIVFRGIAPENTAIINYTIHDKGVVVAQGAVSPTANNAFELTYDPRALNMDFPFISLTAHEGPWEGLSDEVTISLLAVGEDTSTGATITLIGEEIFINMR